MKIENRRVSFWKSISVAIAMAMLVIAPAIASAQSNTSEQTKIAIELEIEKPMIGNLGGITTISIPDMHSLGASGLPVLPTKTVNILLPQGRDVESIEVNGELIAIEGSYVVEWGQEPIPIGAEWNGWTSPDPMVYDSDDLYPGKLYEKLSIQSFRGYNILVMNLFPVQYLPTAGALSYYDNMKISVTTVPAAVDTSMFRGLAQDEMEVAGMVENPWTAGTYGTDRSNAGYGTTSLVNPEDSYPYVIITTNALKSTFQPLLDWKNTKLSSTIVAVEDIYADPAYNGVDDPEEIRNFIKDAYANWETEYVLLGGDDVDDSGTQIVPIRGVYLSAGSSTDNNVPCDMYFGALDGTWNNDGDDHWGEPEEIDYYPEVHVGRITADTSTEIQNWINKVLDYEQNPSAAHLNQCLWIGEKLDASTWGSDSKEEIIPVFPVEDEYQFTKLYQKLGTFSRSNVVSELNKGPHPVNHLGHANSGYTMGIYRSDVDSLTNTDYFFAYSQGCMAGGFDQGHSGNSEAISEHFVYTEHGAFAVIMNARYGWYSPGTTHGPSQYFDYEFFDAIYTENIRNLGAANDDSKTDNAGSSMGNAYLRWCYLELNLHGDPHTEIFEPVKYEHDIAVTGFQAPGFMAPGTTYVSALIRNRGLNDESNIEIEFLVDDVVQETQMISYMESGCSEEVSFEWTPTEYPMEYLVGIHAVPIPDENVTTNNLQEKSVMVEYPPVADAGPDQSSFNYQTVTLDGSNSYDPDDGIVEYKWEFGDGSVGYGAIVTHTYSNCQQYTASLTVKDHYGATDTDTCIISVWQRGHDMELVSMRTPKTGRVGQTKTITIKVKNVGTYDDWPIWITPDNPRSDWALITLRAVKPDGTIGEYTKLVYLNQNIEETVKIPVTLDQRGEWNFEAHVDISNGYGHINPFPRKDQNTANDDLSASSPTNVR